MNMRCKYLSLDVATTSTRKLILKDFLCGHEDRKCETCYGNWLRGLCPVRGELH